MHRGNQPDSVFEDGAETKGGLTSDFSDDETTVRCFDFRRRVRSFDLHQVSHHSRIRRFSEIFQSLSTESIKSDTRVPPLIPVSAAQASASRSGVSAPSLSRQRRFVRVVRDSTNPDLENPHVVHRYSEEFIQNVTAGQSDVNGVRLEMVSTSSTTVTVETKQPFRDASVSQDASSEYLRTKKVDTDEFEELDEFRSRTRSFDLHQVAKSTRFKKIGALFRSKSEINVKVNTTVTLPTKNSQSHSSRDVGAQASKHRHFVRVVRDSAEKDDENPRVVHKYSDRFLQKLYLERSLSNEDQSAHVEPIYSVSGHPILKKQTSEVHETGETDSPPISSNKHASFRDEVEVVEFDKKGKILKGNHLMHRVRLHDESGLDSFDTETGDHNDDSSPCSPEILPGSPEILPGSSEILPGSPEILPGSPEILLGSPEILPGSSEILPGSPDILPGSPEILPCSPEILPESSVCPEDGEGVLDSISHRIESLKMDSIPVNSLESKP